MSSAIYSIFILGPFQSLVVVDVTIYAGALALEFAALIALRIKEPDMPRPYRVPWGWTGIVLVTRAPARRDRVRGVLTGQGRGLREGGRLGRGRSGDRAAALLLRPLAQRAGAKEETDIQVAMDKMIAGRQT